MKKALGFSLIEIVIALIVISLILSALAPIITKKLKSSTTSVRANFSSSIKFYDDCSDFGTDCSMCTNALCALCNKDCALGEYKDVSECKCKTCDSLYDGCLECTSRKCEKCQSGYGLQDGVCTKCQKGSYGNGLEACKLASVGNYVDRDGESSQTPCPVGQYQDEIGKYECKTCSAGTYQDLSGQSGCKICEIDYACSGENNRVQCAVNMGADEGSSFCSACPNNCSDCQIPSSCISCDGGYYLYDGSCFICPAGYSCNGITQIQCSQGQYSPQGSLNCYNCPAGCFACTSSTNCTSCQNGYKLSDGKCVFSCNVLNCSQCVSGNDSKCKICNEGYILHQDNCYKEVACNRDVCLACIKKDNAVVCVSCAEGYIEHDGKCKKCYARGDDGTCSKYQFDTYTYAGCCTARITNESAEQICISKGYKYKEKLLSTKFLSLPYSNCNSTASSPIYDYFISCIDSSNASIRVKVDKPENYPFIYTYRCSGL